MTHVSSHNVHGVTFDPICGCTLDLSDAVGPVMYRGQRYHFCSHRCQSQFFSNPPADLRRELRVTITMAPTAELASIA